MAISNHVAELLMNSLEGGSAGGAAETASTAVDTERSGARDEKEGWEELHSVGFEVVLEIGEDGGWVGGWTDDCVLMDGISCRELESGLFYIYKVWNPILRTCCGPGLYHSNWR